MFQMWNWDNETSGVIEATLMINNIENHGSSHTDFGRYTCEGRNYISTTRATVIVAGQSLFHCIGRWLIMCL